MDIQVPRIQRSIVTTTICQTLAQIHGEEKHLKEAKNQQNRKPESQ